MLIGKFLLHSIENERSLKNMSNYAYYLNQSYGMLLKKNEKYSIAEDWTRIKAWTTLHTNHYTTTDPWEFKEKKLGFFFPFYIHRILVHIYKNHTIV